MTYQSKVVTKVKVLEKKVKLKGCRVKVMASNERCCQKEYNMKYVSSTTYQSKVTTNVKVLLTDGQTE
jgi:hypothetical protein